MPSAIALSVAMLSQELLPEQLQTPPRVVTERTPVVARAAPLSLAPSGLQADEEEALARVSDPVPADAEVGRVLRLVLRGLSRARSSNPTRGLRLAYDEYGEASAAASGTALPKPAQLMSRDAVCFHAVTMASIRMPAAHSGSLPSPAVGLISAATSQEKPRVISRKRARAKPLTAPVSAVAGTSPGVSKVRPRSDCSGDL